MKPSAHSSGGRGVARWSGVVVLLAVVLSVFFFRSYLPGQILFSNDGPYGELSTEHHRLPEAFTGVWNDLNTLGYREQGALPSLTYGLRLLAGTLIFCKFYAPFGLMIAGLGAWCFFRECGLAAPACLLGALAAALNTDFFSTACWGIAAVPITVGMTFFALAALLRTSGWRGWARALLAGLAVGLGLGDGADVGAIFSIFTGVYLAYEALIGEGGLAEKVAGAAGRMVLVVGFAALVAAQPIMALVDTQIKGVAGLEEKFETKEQHWNWATQWSLPKTEALGMLIPGLFGYRINTPGGGLYWGDIGRDAAWEKFYENGQQGAPPPGLRRFNGSGIYSGVAVVLVALWAALQSLLRRDSVFDRLSKRRMWFWMGALILSLLLGFGRHAPFYRLIYGLPFFSTIRNPIKFIEVVNFALVILFAFGVDGLWRRYLCHTVTSWPPPAAAARFDRRWILGCVAVFGLSVAGWFVFAGHRADLEEHLRSEAFAGNFPRMISEFSVGQVGWYLAFFAAGAVLLGIILKGGFDRRRAVLGATLLGVVVGADYFFADQPWITYWDCQNKYASNPVIDQMAANAHEHRVALMPFKAYGNDEYFSALYNSEWLQHLFPLYDIQSLNVVQMPRMPDDLKAFMNATKFDNSKETFPKLIRRYELTNTRYFLGDSSCAEIFNNNYDPKLRRMRVLTRFNLGYKRNAPAGTLYERTTALPAPEGQYALMEFTGALPRAKLFTRWETVTNAQSALDQLCDPAFDVTSRVLVSQNPSATVSPSATNSEAGEVSIVQYASKDVVLKASATAASVLLLNDRYEPHWSVTVDGKPSEMLRCNFLMRGVLLEPGEHQVEFRFNPPAKALYVSVAAIAAGVLVLGIVAFPGWTPVSPSPDPEPLAETVSPPAEAAPKALSKKARRREEKHKK